MFDTVFYTEERTINEHVTGDWKVTHGTVKIEGDSTTYTAQARHHSLELKAYSRDGVHFTVFHVPKLPALIYGNNATVFKKQEDARFRQFTP